MFSCLKHTYVFTDKQHSFIFFLLKILIKESESLVARRKKWIQFKLIRLLILFYKIEMIWQKSGLVWLIKTFSVLFFAFLSTSTRGVHPCVVALRYLPRTHSDSCGLIFHRLICLEHAKLINMGGRSLTYHFPICRYIMRVRTPIYPPLTHMKSWTPLGRRRNKGHYFSQKMGKEARLKKKKRKKKRKTEVEICGTQLEEESFLHRVHPSLWTNISIWNIVRCTLGQQYSRQYLHASDYSAVTTENDTFARFLSKKEKKNNFFYADLTQHPAYCGRDRRKKCDWMQNIDVFCFNATLLQRKQNIQRQTHRCIHLFNSSGFFFLFLFFVACRSPAACDAVDNEMRARQILIFCHAALLTFPSKQCEVCAA